MRLYADTGIFVALYLDESHRNPVQKLIAETQPHFWVTPLLQAEWSHAVFQRVSDKTLAANEARQIMAEFDRDRENGRWNQSPIPRNAVERSMALAREHHGPQATTSDTLHVAIALELRAAQFWTLSPQAAALAAAVNLSVVRPSMDKNAPRVRSRR
ncbi:MAG: type II toxin-antitoxin system VapC family toxin [Terriglobales bacterium]